MINRFENCRKAASESKNHFFIFNFITNNTLILKKSIFLKSKFQIINDEKSSTDNTHFQLSFAQVKTFNNKTIDKKEFENKLLIAMDSLQVNGMSIVVINHGKIVYNKGLGYSNVKSGKRITTSTYFEAASLSKPVFCLFVLKLANQGKIDLDKPLY